MNVVSYIIIATLINADSIAWGISEYDNPVKGVFAGVIEYSDNWYGENTQDTLRYIWQHILIEQLPDDSYSVSWCFDSGLCLYAENGVLELSDWRG
jgi:hypothetical protein